MEHAEIPSATRVVKGGEKGAPALGELLQGNGPIIGSVALPLTHALGRRYSYSYSILKGQFGQTSESLAEVLCCPTELQASLC